MEKLKVNFEVKEDEDILSSMKEAYHACAAAVKYCNEIGIPQDVIDDNITKVFDFVCDINYCKRCPGVKECKKNNPLLISKVVYKNGVVSNQLTPCKALLKQMAFDKQFKVRDFPEDWLNKKTKDLEETKERKKALKKYVDFLKGGYSGWIYLNGGVGTGRSFFAAVISVDAANRNLGPICFLNCGTRLREMGDLQYAKKGNDLQDLITRYSTVPILVLDDFGNEFKTDFIRDAIIYPILSYRASKNLFTIITSDFTIAELKTMYAINKPGEIRARQIANLITNECGEEINLGDIKIH
ncbi:MAG: hypothetical protein K6E21_03735 [Bacilli bacterium]|nr:hypothetical protein [Bacilli bacterium]